MPTTASLAEAHRRNEEPWDAPRGYTKLRCTHCHFWFAAPDPSVTRCVDCELREARRAQPGTTWNNSSVTIQTFQRNDPIRSHA